MNQTSLFLTGVVATLGGSLFVVVYLRRHLGRLLVELCGTKERADFWAAFSNIILMLVPLAITLLYRPKANVELIFQVSNHLAVSLLGLAATVMGMGGVVGSFIPKTTGKT